MLNAQRSAAKHLPRSGLRANEHSEPAMSFPGVADGAASEAGGADGGQRAQTPAKGKSRRWPAQWRSGGGAGGAAVAGGTKPGRGVLRAGGGQSVTR